MIVEADGRPEIAVIGYGFHGPDEWRGSEIAAFLRQRGNEIDGVDVYPMFPEALDAGVRFFNRDLAECFNTAPINDQDLDAIAAARTKRDLREKQPWIIEDLHTAAGGPDIHLVVGRKTTKESLGAAALFGLEEINVVILSDYSYFEVFPQVVQVEINRELEDQKFTDPAWWHKRATILAEKGPDGMRHIYDGQDDEIAMPRLRFWHKPKSAWIMRVDDGGKSDPERIELAKKFERVPYSRPFTRPELTDELLDLLEVRGKNFLATSWADDNFSKPMPELGLRADGNVRRQCFGTLLIEVKQPEEQGDGFLHFSLEHLPADEAE